MAKITIDKLLGRSLKHSHNGGDIGSGTVDGAFLPPALGALSIADTATVDLTLTAGQLTADVINSSITLAKMANIATASFMGRNTALTGVPEVLSVAIVKTMLSLGSASYTASTDYLAAGATAVNSSLLENHNAAYFQTALSEGTDYLNKTHLDAAYAPISVVNYTLPTASASVLGGIKIGSRLSIASGVLSADVQTTDISGKENVGVAAGLVSGHESTYNHANYNTAYGWGNHASVGYLVPTDISSKADLVGGLVPASQLPSYVDDVLSYANLAGFPVTGEDGKIYVAKDTNLTYRWTGSAYGVLDPSLALGETSSTAYRGDRGKTAYDHSQLITGNPHGTTYSDVGADVAGAAAAITPTTLGLVIGTNVLAQRTFGTAANNNTGDFATAAQGALASSALQSLTGAVLTDQTAGQTIGLTGSRLTKLWATDIAVSNAIAGSVNGNAGTVTGLSVTAGQTLTVTTGGTLGSAAYTASGAYDVAGAAAAVTPITLGLVIGTNVQAYNTNLTAIDQALTTVSSPNFVTVTAARGIFSGLAGSNSLQVNALQPANVATTPGTAGDALVSISTSVGGTSTIATTGAGGVGGLVSIVGGTGGQATAAATASTGGNGGAFSLTAAGGGAASVAGTGTNNGGRSGLVSIISAASGVADGATSGVNTGGNSQATTIIAAAGGAASNSTTTNTGGNGGPANFGAGAGGASISNTGVTNVGGNGGSVIIAAGVGGAANSAATTNTAGNAGILTMSGGTGGIGTTTSTNGGSCTFQGGAAAAAVGSSSGSVTIQTPNGSSVGSGGPAGSVQFFGGNAGGDGTVDRNAGRVNVTGGNAKGNGIAGLISYTAGNADQTTNTTANAGGTITFTGGLGSGVGAAAGGAGGQTNLNGGQGGMGSSTPGAGGSVTLQGGLASANAGSAGGAATIQGRVGSATTTGGAGGNVSVLGGAAGGDGTVNRAGGTVTITSGTAKGDTVGAAVTVTAGNGGLGTVATGAIGGALNLVAGNGGANTTGGVGGAVTIKGGLQGAGGTAGGGAIIFQTAATTSLAEAGRFDKNGNLTVTGNVTLTTATSGIILKQGTNGHCGTFVANGVTPVTISNTGIAITDCIIISLNTVGGTVGVQPHVATITAGTGFTVICTALDTSTYNYAIIGNQA